MWAGAQASESILSFYWACDLFVWPALNEAYGMALLEAQASGLPVVAGQGGGVADVVRHGESGLLVKAGDSAAFANAVTHCLSYPRELAIMAEVARARARQCHDLQSVQAAFDVLLDDLGVRRAS